MQLGANGVPNVIAIYRWSLKTSKIVARLGCQTASNGVNTVNVPGELQKGDAYTVQVGALTTPAGPVAGSVAFTAKFLPDHDGDGVFDPLDACPLLAGISKLGGCPPALSPAVNWSANGQMLTEFQASSLPAGARILVKCSCGVSQTKTVPASAGVVVLTALVGRTLPPGATVQVWATKRPSGKGTFRFGAIGAYLRYVMSSGHGFGPRAEALPDCRARSRRAGSARRGKRSTAERPPLAGGSRLKRAPARGGRHRQLTVASGRSARRSGRRA